jgi:N-acetylmuramoyl-L-alanine amidase
MAISTPRTYIGVGIASLALLGGAATGVANATTATDSAGSSASGSSASVLHERTTALNSSTAGPKAADSSLAKTCTYQNGFGFSCGYYKGHGTVRVGSRGNAVKEVQALINQTTNYPHHLAVDGKFGQKTKSGVVWFQKKYHVKPYDGIVGPKTWKELRLK